MNTTGEISGLEVSSLVVSLTVAVALAVIGICKRMKHCASRCDDHTVSLTLVREMQDVIRRVTSIERGVSRGSLDAALPEPQEIEMQDMAGVDVPLETAV